MGNIGGGEVLVILIVALLFLGPAKLPEAARQVGKVMGEIRKVTSGFQRELHDAMNDSDESDARARGAAVAATRPVPSAEQLPDPQTTTVQATPVQVAPAIEATPPASDASHPVAPPAASSDGESPALGSDR